MSGWPVALDPLGGRKGGPYFFFFFTLVTGPRRSLSLKLSDTGVYEPQIRARLVTTAHFGFGQGRLEPVEDEAARDHYSPPQHRRRPRLVDLRTRK